MDDAFPDVFEGRLDAAGLAQLANDLVSCARVLDVQARGVAGSHSFPAGSSLDESLAALREGLVGALQVRYVHQGAEWRDTLLAAGDGFRLVRVKVPVFPVDGPRAL